MNALVSLSERNEPRAMARSLGWLGIALGVTELVAAEGLARWLGVRGSEPVLRAYGLREIGTGLGILASDQPAAWMWGRVLGDGLDLATLAPHLNDRNRKRPNLTLAMAGVLGVMVADIACAQALSRQTARRQRVQRRVQARPTRDYGRRSGFPRSPAAMRGAASDFIVPDDFRIPKALQPWGAG